MKTRAAVAHQKAQPFQIELLDLEAPRADEVLVRVVGVGVCHTDIKALEQIRPVPLPIVLGHEGAGIVEAVGPEVTKVRPGDPVVLTFNSCGVCSSCRTGRPAYCDDVIPLSFGGQRPDGSTALSRAGQTIHSHFFGQSSFATFTLATERNVVKVSQEAPLEILGPLGCGIQTGAGAVLNSLAAQPGNSIAIFGVGSVGLSAVMAASVAGCATIVAVDLKRKRLALALELGATHILDPQDTSDPVSAILDIQPGGVDYALDTTSNPAMFRRAAECIKILGVCGLIGGSAPGVEVCFEMNHILPGRTVRGILQGDSLPDQFIPRLIELHLQDRFPFDRLIKTYDFEEINHACDDMRAGTAIKPVLLMTGSHPPVTIADPSEEA